MLGRGHKITGRFFYHRQICPSACRFCRCFLRPVLDCKIFIFPKRMFRRFLSTALDIYKTFVRMTKKSFDFCFVAGMRGRRDLKKGAESPERNHKPCPLRYYFSPTYMFAFLREALPPPPSTSPLIFVSQYQEEKQHCFVAAWSCFTHELSSADTVGYECLKYMPR